MPASLMAASSGYGDGNPVPGNNLTDTGKFDSLISLRTRAGAPDTGRSNPAGLPASSNRGQYPGGPKKGLFLGKFKVTFYWMVEEDNYPGKKTQPLYSADGRLLGRFTPEFVKDFKMESCALLSDGRIISYLKKANRCIEVDAPIGLGHTLVEMKSIAVDPAVIPLGSRVYIPEAVGTVLPDGGVHNGIFYAHDIGSAIKGQRIDVYVGLKPGLDAFRSTALCNPGYVSVHLLQ